MKVWVNIAASNNAWSGGVTPEHLAAIAAEAPAVKVYDLSDESLIGVTSTYEIRADGAELWAHLDLEREPGGKGKWHGESVLMREPGGQVELGAVVLIVRGGRLGNGFSCAIDPNKPGGVSLAMGFGMPELLRKLADGIEAGILEGHGPDGITLTPEGN